MEIFTFVVYLATGVSLLFLILPLIVMWWFVRKEKRLNQLGSARIIVMVSSVSWLVVVVRGWREVFVSARTFELASFVFFLFFLIALLVRRLRKAY